MKTYKQITYKQLNSYIFYLFIQIPMKIMKDKQICTEVNRFLLLYIILKMFANMYENIKAILGEAMKVCHLLCNRRQTFPQA